MLVAGPCGITDKSQAFRIAEFVQRQGATHFRGGAYKGQNRPIVNGKPEYLGLGESGLKILAEVQDEFKFPCVCDAQSKEQAYLIAKYNIKYMMVGARNMDNLCLLRDIRHLYDTYNPRGKIILKRGPSATVDEWIGAAEHLGGEDRVVLCERGIVSFDRTPQTRWRLDFVGVAHIKAYTKYKVIVDPSHGSGDRKLTKMLSKCALAISDGIMVEVHYDPDSSPTDAKQTIDFDTFSEIARIYKEGVYGKR